LRSRRVTPNMKALEQMADRMENLRSRIAEVEQDPLLSSECARLRGELRKLIIVTQENANSLRRHCN